MFTTSFPATTLMGAPQDAGSTAKGSEAAASCGVGKAGRRLCAGRPQPPITITEGEVDDHHTVTPYFGP